MRDMGPAPSRVNLNYLVVSLSAALALSLAACSGGGTAGGTGGMTGHDAGNDAGSGGKGTGGKIGVGGMGVGGSQACFAPKYSHVSTFGAILDSWVVAANSTPGSLAPVPGVDGGAGTGTLVEIDTTDGMPATPVLGSVKLTIPFDQPNEEMLFAQNFNGLNMMGETVTAYIKLNSGLNTGPVNVGRAFLILKTTAAYNYVAGPAISLDPSAGWVQLSIDVNNPQAALPPGYDPCDVREIDVSVQTGGTGTYTTAVLHIDTIAVGVPGAVDDAGTDSGTSTDAPVDTPSSVDTGSDTAPVSDAASDGG
jgi:hypothetical protein